MRAGMAQVNISEAWALENNDESTFQNAVSPRMQRHERRRPRSLPQPLEADARAMLLEASSRARATLQSLEGLLKNLIAAQDAGQHRDDLGGHVRGPRSREHDARSAASPPRRARPFTSSGRRRSSSTSRNGRRAACSSRFFDDGLMSEGLEQVAGQTRGSMSVVNGDGKIAFDRLGRELSGLLPDWLRAERSGPHGPRAAHQGGGEDRAG